MRALHFTSILAALLGGACTVHAQPAGRGAAQNGPALSVTQQLTLAREMEVPTELTLAQATASAALIRASLALPANPADITAKANDLAAAELALASARAEGFQRTQRALQPLTAEQAGAYARGNTGGGGRGGGASAANWRTAYNDRTGFVALFDGTTLNGWEGEAGKWDVQDGAIHRHQTLEPKNFVDFGQYHLHYKEVFSDFDLRVEFKIKSGNAGIQYRARLETALRAQDGEPARIESGRGGGAAGGVTIPLRNVAAAIADPLGKPLPGNIKTLDDALSAGLLPAGPPYGNGTGHPWQVSGYQFDITGAGTGNWYEGQGRGTVGSAGDIIMLLPNSGRQVVGKVADLPWAQWGNPNGEWNAVQIIARGNTVIHMLNGRVILVGVDDDPERRALKGIISLQLEGPQDNEVWYRNIYIKKL
jgi:hypothetical protein